MAQVICTFDKRVLKQQIDVFFQFLTLSVDMNYKYSALIFNLESNAVFSLDFGHCSDNFYS